MKITCKPSTPKSLLLACLYFYNLYYCTKSHTVCLVLCIFFFFDCVGSSLPHVGFL